MPDLDLPGMDFFNMPPGGYGGGEEMPLPDDLLPVLREGDSGLPCPCWRECQKRTSNRPRNLKSEGAL